MFDQMLDMAGLKLKLAEFSLQFVKLGMLLAVLNQGLGKIFALPKFAHGPHKV